MIQHHCIRNSDSALNWLFNEEKIKARVFRNDFDSSVLIIFTLFFHYFIYNLTNIIRMQIK